MKDVIIYSVILFLIVGISCGILAYVNQLTEPYIKENKRVAEENARLAVFPEATTFIKNTFDSFEYYHVYDAEENLLGYTFIASKFGYADVIRTMVGVYTDKTINRIAILEQKETPGLGTKYESPSFTDRFSGLRQSDLKIDRDGGKIDSITGATITARAIVNSIHEYIDILTAAIEANKFKPDETIDVDKENGGNPL
jgi:electron transport complex protein RnfG